jgi:hypothetical protein
VLWSVVYLVVRRLFEVVPLICRLPPSKELEMLVLRHELAKLRRQTRQPRMREVDLVLLAAFSRAMPRKRRRPQRERPHFQRTLEERLDDVHRVEESESFPAAWG